MRSKARGNVKLAGDEYIHSLQKENKEWQACYEQQKELGEAQYREMRNIAMAIHDREYACSNALDDASQHGVNWRVLA